MTARIEEVSMQITLSQAIEGYELAAYARRLSPQTLADYRNSFGKFQAWLGGDPAPEDISADDIRSFLASQNGIAAKTLLNYHTGLSALWRWAKREKIVDANIVRGVVPPRPEQSAIEPYSEADVRAMLQAVAHSAPYKRGWDTRQVTHSVDEELALRNKAVLLLLLDTGLRASELCKLRIADADLKNRRIKVMGKGAKERILRFSANTATAIWRYLCMRDDSTKVPGRPLFVTNANRRITRVNLYHTIQRIGERVGLAGANVHPFRHPYAIQYLRNGGNPYALQMSLGHSTMEMTKRYLAIAQADLESDHQVASPVANWGL
jgi:integrase/recombinase XerD